MGSYSAVKFASFSMISLTFSSGSPWFTCRSMTRALCGSHASAVKVGAFFLRALIGGPSGAPGGTSTVAASCCKPLILPRDRDRAVDVLRTGSHVEERSEGAACEGAAEDAAGRNEGIPIGD